MSHQIIEKIINFERKNLLYRLFAGMVSFIVFCLIIWISTVLADSVFYFSSAVRWFILIFNGGITLYLFYRLFLSNLIKLLRLTDKNDLTPVAKIIGQYHPVIGDRLTNMYQLICNLPPGSSAAIRDHAINYFLQTVRNISFSDKIKFRNFLLPAGLIVSVLLGSISLYLLTPDMMTLSVRRIIDPSGEYAKIPNYSFKVIPGDKEIIAGNSLAIRVSYHGPDIENCIFKYRNISEKTYQSILMRKKSTDYILHKDNIRESIDYYIQAVPVISAEWKDKLISQTFKVTTHIPPFINELSVKIVPPEYTQLPETFLESNVGDIAAYPGSFVSISGRTNKLLQEAHIVFSDSTKESGIIRDDKFSFDFIVNRDLSYSFLIRDREKIGNQNPIEYNITLLEDFFPAVEIVEPGEDIEIAADGAINLLIEGNDDFGISAMRLNYQILGKIKETTDSTWQQIPISIGSYHDTHFQHTYFWNFDVMPVSFDDAVKYFVSVTDNDIINGPKMGRSSIYYIHFPSLDQLFDEFNMAQEENIETTEDLAAESEELKKDLEEISREMKREKEIDWERKRSLEASLEKQKKIQEKLKKIEENLEKAIEKLEKNELFSPEILEKYQRLQQMFEEIATPELLQAMKDVQKNLDDLNQKNTQRSLEQFKINQERFKENLDRTLALFNKVRLEQELDRLVQMSEAMKNEQDKITENLSKKEPLSENEMSSVREKENEQLESLNNLERLAEDLFQDKTFDQYPETKEQLAKSVEMTDQIRISMQKVSQKVSQMNQQESKEQSEETSQNLDDLNQSLQNAQQNMMQKDRQKIMAKMEKITSNLLQLSKKEEELINRTQNLSNFSDKYPETAQSQQNQIENMGRVTRDLIDLSHETFFLSPGMSKALGSAHGNMKRSLEELENRRRGPASNFQKKSMAGLNKAIMQMQESMESMSSSKSSLGFEQYLEQMQQLSNQQGQINQESLNLFGQNQGKLSMQQQGQLRRMAAEQGAIREALEELGGNMQDDSDVLGDLDQMAKEMGEVMNDLQSLQIDKKTIERQQQILSRMLDAQKSVREKDFSRKRLAEVGKNYQRKSPGKSENAENMRLKQLKLDLIRALREGYNPDYEKLIEEYFRTLNTDLSN